MRERAHSEIANLFPDFGFYPVTDPVGQMTDAPIMGNGIDDLPVRILPGARSIAMRFPSEYSPAAPIGGKRCTVLR